MKISLLQENFNKGLSLVSRQVSGKATLPILANILLSTENGRLRLSATNLETGINLWLGSKVEEEGSLTLPAKVLNEFVASLPPDKIEIEASETSLTAVSGSFKANFIGTVAAEFPKLPVFSDKPILIFEKNDFLRSLSRVAFAAAQDEGRPVLTGVLIKKKDKGKVTLVATDGYRLSLKSAVAIEDKLEEDLLIPAKTLLEVSKIAQEKGEENKEIKIAQTEEKSQVVFSLKDIEFSSRLLEGEFPDFDKIIPKTSTTKAEFDKEEFLRAVKIASIFAREQANIVKLKIDPQAGKMKITAETPQVGANESEIVAKIEGEEMEIAFNCRFLLDFLAAVKEEVIILEANGSLAPGLFKVKGDDTYLHIIMPVRTQV
ncbi:MAG: DNA polymerase III subunit beta [bacterium]|nr:DNA polymerase III subunit beta [bacterium]